MVPSTATSATFGLRSRAPREEERLRMCTSILNNCGRSSDWQQALWLLEEMPLHELRRNAFSCSSSITSCARAQRWPWCLEQLLQMQQASQRLDDVSLGAALRGCRGGAWPAALVLLAGHTPNVVGYNAAVTACGVDSQWQIAFGILEWMKRRSIQTDLWSYNALINAVEVAAHWELALQLLEEAEQLQLAPDCFSFGSCISSCEASGEWQVALHLLAQMELQGLLLQEVPCNAAISVCATGQQWQHAVAVLHDMSKKRLQIDIIGVNAAINACARSARWEEALSLVRSVYSLRLQRTVVSCNAAMTACEKSGEWQLALALLQEMQQTLTEPTVISFGAAISACQKGLQWDAALTLLSRIGEMELQANEICFCAAMTACAAAGQWRRSMDIIDAMLDAGIDGFHGADYDHSFQAGSSVDCFKHSVLTLLLQRLSSVEAPFTYVDTHGGWGLYNLTHDTDAYHNSEFGVAQLDAAEQLHPTIQAYLENSHRLHSSGGSQLGPPRLYLGSPLLAQQWLRPQDRGIFLEMAPSVHAKLLQHQKMLDPSGVSNAEVLRANSYWWLLRAARPETFSQRGLVLVDPPYEPYQSFMAWNLRLLQFLESKWPSACVAVWYPCLDGPQLRNLYQGLSGLGMGHVLVVEFGFRDSSADSLQNSGFLIQNPPEHTVEHLREAGDGSLGCLARSRLPSVHAYGPLGLNCTGDPSEEELCDTELPCPIDCQFEDWGDWGKCQLQPCGPAQRLRSRERGSAQFGGAPCLGNLSEVEDCEIPGAPPVPPCNVTVPFSPESNKTSEPEGDESTVTKPPAGSAEVNPPKPPLEAAVVAAKEAAQQNATPDEQAAAAGQAAAAAPGGNPTVAAEAAQKAAEAAGESPTKQVEMAVQAAASAAARSSGGNATKASTEAAKAATKVAAASNLTQAEEAVIIASAARESASESGADVESVGKAAAASAKAEGATPEEQAAAAAVAASDAAKKQGANATQAAEVAIAAEPRQQSAPHASVLWMLHGSECKTHRPAFLSEAKAAGATPQEQASAASVAYTRAGGNETLDTGSFGLPPAVHRPVVSEKEAEEIAEKEPEAVEGSEVLEVSDPETFMHDAAALEAVRDALAEELGVDPDAIIVKGAEPASVSANSPSMLEMGRKSSAMARRQAPAKGEVNITYEVVPSISGKSDEDVVKAVAALDGQTASKVHEKIFASKNLPYAAVQVSGLDLFVENKADGYEFSDFETGAAVLESTITGVNQLNQHSGATLPALAAWAGRMEAAVGRPTARQPLWLKVDRAVQRAARIELGRMRTALEVSDPDQLQAMMTWWMARDASAASSGGMATARLLQEDSAREEGEETLGALLFSERLHRRFPYTSFYGRDDYAVGGTPSEASAPGAEFERLQQALQQNLEALQDLRSKLAPYQDASRNSGLLWRWADVVAVASRFREALRLPSKAQRALAVVPAAAATRNGMALTRRFSEVDFSDNIAEFTTICGLFLAAVIGLLGFCAAALWHNYGWAAGLFAFGAANSVLLRNYSRLHLPHVRRRLEHRLKELSQQKDSLIRDVQQVQHASRKTGVVQVRAHIFLQSVNVIRNIDYLTRCIKTEVQRLASDRNPRKAQLRRRLASSGLQLLLALLPHSPPQWQQEALGGENCAELASLLYARRRGLAPPVASEVLSSGYMESRKRLWLLFRMVHLSSAIPTEVQGKLTALVDSYLRPVLVERRVPTGYCQVLANPANSSHAMLEDSKREGEDLGEDAQQHGSAKGASVSSARSVESEDQTAESEDTFSFCASTASQSKISSTSCDRMGDTSKAVRKLFATRSDIMQVLKRLPPPALMSPSGSTTQTDSILREIFTSVAVGVAKGQQGQSQGQAGAAGAVGLAIGYQYGERPYNLSGRVQTTLELKVALPQAQSQTGSSSSASGTPLEVKVQLCQLSDSEPSAVEALAAWSDLAAALPLRFNDSALRVRRRHLKKAKEALRSLPKG
ncbi:rlmJ [Symbiodinium sp. CCMP2456]|nr:rlmJ [Symbiodinium sp. CCMP2456]